MLNPKEEILSINSFSDNLNKFNDDSKYLNKKREKTVYISDKSISKINYKNCENLKNGFEEKNKTNVLSNYKTNSKKYYTKTHKKKVFYSNKTDKSINKSNLKNYNLSKENILLNSLDCFNLIAPNKRRINNWTPEEVLFININYLIFIIKTKN